MLPSVLHRIPLFASLTGEQLHSLVSRLVEHSYPAETVLFREGEPGDVFYVIVDGYLSVLKEMDSPNERLLQLIGPGEFLGEMSLLSKTGLRTASVRVHTDARLLEMTRAQFVALLEGEPGVAYDLLCALNNRLTETTNSAMHDLIEGNARLSQAYADLKAAQVQIIEKEVMERELKQAQEIQISMLPERLPQVPGYDIGACMLPARMVGGDLYNVFMLDDDHVGLVVGDVSGKGVPAALFMALTCSLLRVEARPGISPEVVLRQVNRHLRSMNARGMFVTLLYGVLECSTRQFAYVRAGHELPMVWTAEGGFTPQPVGEGQVLGLLEQPQLQSQTIHLTPGSLLLLYTDGVTEARCETGEFYEEGGLERDIPGLLKDAAQAICDRLIEILSQFSVSQAQADDITLVALKLL